MPRPSTILVLVGLLLGACSQEVELREHESADARVRSRAASVMPPERVRGESRESDDRSREVAEAIEKACPGLGAPELRECPVGSRTISSVSDVRRGVRVRLAYNVGDAAAVERRIACHYARLELDRDFVARTGRSIEPSPPCFLDLAGTESDVESDDGRVSVLVTTRDASTLEELRILARRGVPRSSNVRTTAARAHARRVVRD